MKEKNQFGSVDSAVSAFQMLVGTSYPPTKGVYVGGTGDLIVQMADGNQATFSDISAGIVHPLRITEILAGTSATAILGLR